MEQSVAEELEDAGVPGCAWTTPLSLASESEKRKETLCCI